MTLRDLAEVTRPVRGGRLTQSGDTSILHLYRIFFFEDAEGIILTPRKAYINYIYMYIMCSLSLSTVQ